MSNEEIIDYQNRDKYLKNFILLNNNSLFIFSDNKFICISESDDWTIDAIEAGITPSNIALLYLTKDDPNNIKMTKIDSSALKNKMINIIVKERNYILPDNIPEKSVKLYKTYLQSYDSLIGEIRLFLQNDRIKIVCNNMKIEMLCKNGFLQKGKLINISFLEEDIKEEFNLIIDSPDNNNISLQMNKPLYFHEIFDFIEKRTFQTDINTQNDNITSEDNYSGEEILKSEIHPKKNTFLNKNIVVLLTLVILIVILALLILIMATKVGIAPFKSEKILTEYSSNINNFFL